MLSSIFFHQDLEDSADCRRARPEEIESGIHFACARSRSASPAPQVRHSCCRDRPAARSGMSATFSDRYGNALPGRRNRGAHVLYFGVHTVHRSTVHIHCCAAMVMFMSDEHSRDIANVPRCHPDREAAMYQELSAASLEVPSGKNTSSSQLLGIRLGERVVRP